MIIVEINSEYKLKEQLEGTNCDDFSLFGLKTIMDYINDFYTVTPYNFNVCEFGSEFDEYSDATGSTLDLDDLISDFGYMLEGEEIDEEKEPWVNVAEAIEAEGRNTVLWIQSESVNGIVVVTK